MKAISILSCGLLAGCTAFNAGNQGELLAANEVALCSAYGHSAYSKHFTAIKAEIQRRELVDPGSWPDIKAQKVRVGMTACAVRASWGEPNEINRASYGDQWVYCRGGAHCYRRQYVYIRGGRVHAWN